MQAIAKRFFQIGSLLFTPVHAIINARGIPYGRRCAPFISGEGVRFLFTPSRRREGGIMAYVTYSDLIQLGILIVAIITLFQIKKK